MRSVNVLTALLGLSVGLGLARGQLPEGCTPLNDQIFSSVDPTSFFEANAELQDIAPPLRFGNLRSREALPTQHFATNQMRRGGVAMRLFPYSAVMTNEGITYDSYNMATWNVSERSDEMMQQTPSVVNEPWNKVVSLGTNMKQMTSAPDGNPKGVFTGRSGIQVGIEGSGDPVLTDLEEMYANFLYTGKTGTMEVPLVRGSPLLTHKFVEANPTLVPYCISSINGVATTYMCPVENSAEDGGSGFADAECTGGVMTAILRTTKRIALTQVQFAVNTAAGWAAGDRGMTTCTPQTCTINEDGREVRASISGASGTMNYAINVIGRYILPPNDWTNNPLSVVCDTRRRRHVGLVKASPPKPQACATTFCHTPTCSDAGNGNTQFQVVVELDTPIADLGQIQFAVAPTSKWNSMTPMLTCSSSGLCQLSTDLRTITYSNTFSGIETSFSYAVNVIGRFVQPPGDWQASPFTHKCGDVVTTTTPIITTTTVPATDPPATEGPTLPPPTVGEIPPCTSDFCKNPSCTDAGNGMQYFTLILQFENPIDDITRVQIALNTAEQWASSHPMITCTASECSLSSDGKTLTFKPDPIPEGAIKYAINVIGRFLKPEGDWGAQPYQYQCGGSGTVIATDTAEFVIELDEPVTSLVSLPGQTRKFKLYFSEPMVCIGNANGLYFEPMTGGLFNGILQIAYVGANARGDLSNVNFHDSYAGVYSYKPKQSFCADGTKAYVNWAWNKHNVNGPTTSGNLLMIAMPHHDELLQSRGQLLNTPHTFKGFVGDSWLMEEPLPRSSMNPDPAAVDKIRSDPTQLQNILTAIANDASGQDLNNICSISDSYGVGKAISMVARLASISRAFGTTHYQQLDGQIKSCLEKWLRIDDTLSDGNKFRYETVWGGLMLRCADAGSPINIHGCYGFPVFADHHFHVGYFIYALAYYVQHDIAWKNTHIDRIYALARDVGNPNSKGDKWFPVARHKDWYMGMSWATGIGPGSRQEESSSEALNCYHAIAALGAALGDPVMEQTGQVLLATELRAVRWYFTVRNDNYHLFPQYIKEFGAMGQIAEDSFFVYTLNWPCDPFEFPMRHACLVGIQIIPITSISKYYMDQVWASRVKNSCSWALNPLSAPGANTVDQSILRPVSTGWGAFCHSILAKYDSAHQQAAAEYVKDLTPNRLVGGTGAASTLLFIYADS